MTNLKLKQFTQLIVMLIKMMKMKKTKNMTGQIMRMTKLLNKKRLIKKKSF